jgi:hypothetical protein
MTINNVQNFNNYIKANTFWVLTAMLMKVSIFWDTMSCIPSKVDRCFGGKCIHFQVPPKHLLTFNGLQSDISLETELYNDWLRTGRFGGRVRVPVGSGIFSS